MATRDGSLVITPVTPTSTKGRFVTHEGYFAESGIPGTIITTYYKKRARDSGSVSPQYVIWVTLPDVNETDKETITIGAETYTWFKVSFNDVFDENNLAINPENQTIEAA